MRRAGESDHTSKETSGQAKYAWPEAPHPIS